MSRDQCSACELREAVNTAITRFLRAGEGDTVPLHLCLDTVIDVMIEHIIACALTGADCYPDKQGMFRGLIAKIPESLQEQMTECGREHGLLTVQ